MNTRLSGGIWGLCLSKVTGLIYRTIDLVRWLPRRLWRLLNHLWTPARKVGKLPNPIFSMTAIFYWFVELFFLIGDILGLGELYETLCDIVKFNTRPLDEREREIVETIFGNQLNTLRIRVDEFAFWGPRSHAFAYVSFYTINSWGDIGEDLFAHELVHIWQYHRMGSVYIPRALRAQASTEGYDYGGVPNLVLAIRSGKKLSDFNLEQQGDIIADYYRILSGGRPRWSKTGKEDLWIYEHLIQGAAPESSELAA